MFKFRKARGDAILNDLGSFLREVSDEPIEFLTRTFDDWRTISYAELEDLILAGRLQDLIDWQQRYAEFVNTKLSPLWLAAIARASFNSTRGKITIDDSDPRVKDFLRQRAGELITQLSDESKRAVANVILRGQAEHLAPREIARQIRPLIGLNERQAQANVNYRQRVFNRLIDNGLSIDAANQRADRSAVKYASKQHRQRAETIVHTELARAYNQGAHDGILAAQRAGLMNHCEMVWSTAGTNRVCGRCLSLKDTVVGRTNEQGVQLPPLHPRCRCTIIYREVAKPLTSPARNGNVGGRGLAAGNSISLEVSGKSPYLISKINPKDTAQVKQVLDWFENSAVTAPVENAIIITTAGEIYHCTGGLNSLDPIVELGNKLRGSIVTHNHPVGSVNEYSFSEADRNLFKNFKLARLRGVDERFIYELNRDPNFLDDEENATIDETFGIHFLNIKMARFFKYGYRRWLR